MVKLSCFNFQVKVLGPKEIVLGNQKQWGATICVSYVLIMERLGPQIGEWQLHGGMWGPNKGVQGHLQGFWDSKKEEWGWLWDSREECMANWKGWAPPDRGVSLEGGVVKGKGFVYYSVSQFWLMIHSELVCIYTLDSKPIYWAPSRQAICTISLPNWWLTNPPYQPGLRLQPSTSQSLSGYPNH